MVHTEATYQERILGCVAHSQDLDLLGERYSSRVIHCTNEVCLVRHYEH
jgi:hypothetical protein